MMQLYLNGNLFKGSEEELLAIEKFTCKRWRLNHLLHRDNGPAVIFSNGSFCWYRNGHEHREGGPARVTISNRKEYSREIWYQNGLYHRDDGPAVIYSTGRAEWWLNGFNVGEEYHKMICEYIFVKDVLNS